jgi:hypothetical protein
VGAFSCQDFANNWQKLFMNNSNLMDNSFESNGN